MTRSKGFRVHGSNVPSLLFHNIPDSSEGRCLLLGLPSSLRLRTVEPCIHSARDRIRIPRFAMSHSGGDGWRRQRSDFAGGSGKITNANLILGDCWTLDLPKESTNLMIQSTRLCPCIGRTLWISRLQKNRRSKCWRCSCIPRPLDCLVFGFINKAQWIWSNAFQMLSSRVPEMTLHWCCTPLALRRNQRSWPGQL